MLEFLLQIGVAVKSAAVVAKELLALFERDFSLLNALCYPYFELTDEFLRIVLNIFEHLFHGFAIDDLVDVVAAVFHRKVHGIGVAEKIVQITEYFLVGTNKENAKIIRFIATQRVHRQHVSGTSSRYKI